MSYKESKQAYICRKCRHYMGCAVCAGDIATLVCSECHDWANDISERVHGKMIKNPEVKVAAMRVVMDCYSGRLTPDETDERFKQLFNPAQARELGDG